MSAGKTEIDWRPATDADENFLRAVVMERGAWPTLPKALFDQLAETQWRAWQAGRSPDEEVFVVHRGADPVGMLVLHRDAERIRVVDLTIRSTTRNQGLGGAVLRRIQAGGLLIELQVRKQNPAQRLYKRLGFEPIEIDELDVRMRWTP